MPHPDRAGSVRSCTFCEEAADMNAADVADVC